MSACQNGASTSKLKLLLNNGANILFPCHNNEHSLHFAIDGSSKKRVTKVLLGYLLKDALGSKQLEYERINRRETLTGWTYIMRATFEGSLGAIEAMLQFNASCNIKDNADRTIIHLAAEKNNPQILTLEEWTGLQLFDRYGFACILQTLEYCQCANFAKSRAMYT